MKKTPSQLHEDESAVTAIEYALLASLIAVVIVVSVGIVGVNLNTLFTSVKDLVVLALQ